MVSLFQTREHSQRCPSPKMYLEIVLFEKQKKKLSFLRLLSLKHQIKTSLLYCFRETKIFFFFTPWPLLCLQDSPISTLNTDVFKHQVSILCILFLHKPIYSHSFKCHCFTALMSLLSLTLTSKLTICKTVLSLKFSTWFSDSHLTLSRFLTLHNFSMLHKM